MNELEQAQLKLRATREHLRWAVARGDHELVKQLRQDSYGRWVELEQLKRSENLLVGKDT